jgi:hypothetical protein
MAVREIESFEQFWDFYVGEHKKKSTRLLHFVGLSAAMGCALGGVLTKKRWLLLMAPVMGYGPAWVSHFFIEKNTPASFAYPLWSLRADFLMWWKTATGRMQAEVDRVAAEEEVRAAAAAVAASSAPASSQSEAVN